MNDTALARQLREETAALYRTAVRCRELAGDTDLHAPLLRIITDRISALVEELCWEVAAVQGADLGDDA